MSATRNAGSAEHGNTARPLRGSSDSPNTDASRGSGSSVPSPAETPPPLATSIYSSTSMPVGALDLFALERELQNLLGHRVEVGTEVAPSSATRSTQNPSRFDGSRRCALRNAHPRRGRSDRAQRGPSVTMPSPAHSGSTRSAGE